MRERELLEGERREASSSFVPEREKNPSCSRLPKEGEPGGEEVERVRLGEC